MPISSIKYLVRAKTALRNFVFTTHEKPVKPDYSKYVKISKELKDDTFAYLDGLKSTIGNYAKHNNIEVRINPVKNNTENVSVDVFARENLLQERLFNVFDMAHEQPVKLNKQEMVVKINPQDRNEVISPARKVYKAVSDVMKTVNETFNPHLRQK